MEQIKESLIRISYLNCSTSSERTSEASQKKWLIGLFNEWIEAVAKNDHLPLLDWRLFSEMLDSKNHALRRAAAESLTREISILNHCDPLFVEEVLLPHFLVQNYWSKNVDSFIEVFSPDAFVEGEDDQGCGGDRGDGSGIEGDVLEGLEVLDQGVGPLGGSPH